MATEKVLTPQEWPDIHDWFTTQFSVGGSQTSVYPLTYTGEHEVVIDRVIVVAPAITGGAKTIALAYDDDDDTVDAGSSFIIGTNSAGVAITSNGVTILTPTDNNVVPKGKHLSAEVTGAGFIPLSLLQVSYRTKRK